MALGRRVMIVATLPRLGDDHGTKPDGGTVTGDRPVDNRPPNRARWAGPGDGTSGPGDSRPETDPGTARPQRAAVNLAAAVSRYTVLDAAGRATPTDVQQVRELTATYLRRRGGWRHG